MNELTLELVIIWLFDAYLHVSCFSGYSLLHTLTQFVESFFSTLLQFTNLS